MSTQAQWMTQPKSWPLVNNLNSRDGLFDKDARLVNAFAEKDVTTGKYIITKRPGLGPTVFELGSPGDGQGLFVWRLLRPSGIGQGFRYLIIWTVGSVIETYFDLGVGATYSPGSVPGIIGKVSYLQFPNVTNPMVMLSGNSGVLGLAAGYYMDIQIVGLVPRPVLHTIANYPVNTVAGLAYLDGTAYVMDIYGQIWNTLNFNDPTVWDPLGVIQANASPDYGVVLSKQLTYIVALKQWTTTFFYDAGNANGSPLAPVPGVILNFGCLSADTFQSMDGVLFWVTMSQDHPSQVVLLADLQHQVISTPAIERALDLSGSTVPLGGGGVVVGPTQFYSMVFKRGGHKFYLISNVTKNITFVYDIGEKLWALWTDPVGDYFPMMSQTVDPTGRWLMQRGDTGTVIQGDSAYIYPTDQGIIAPVDIYTPNYDADIDRGKLLNMMRFHADQHKGSILKVRCSDNDYETWTNFREVNLGNKRPILTDCGTFNRRAYHFRHEAATSLRITSVDLQMDIGTL